jgi:hypothetical protein
MALDYHAILMNLQGTQAPNSFTDAQVVDYLTNVIPGASDRDIAAHMTRLNVGVDQVARATKLPVADVQKRFVAATAPLPTEKFKDTDITQYIKDRGGSLTEPQLMAEMISTGVSPEQYARATNTPLAQVQTRYGAVVNPLMSSLPIPGGASTPATTPTTTPGTTTTPTRTATAPIPPGLTPGNVDTTTIVATPPITTGVVPQMPTQYITPTGALGNAPAGVSQLAVPMLNMRNVINQDVVPNIVAAPKTTPQLSYTPITQLGVPRIF